MTAGEPITASLSDTSPQIPMQVVPQTTWDRVEIWLERVGEYLNPILVKEARQALKSKQFVITFTLVLVCGWGWSLLGVAAIGQDVFYAPSGPYMLIGYFWVLAFPLILIVPFAAFRSLASEREDGTYELLSITTLWPRQIVGGKLGSSLLQMIVYLSALAPCIAFTYLLRGIDIISILLFVVYVFVASLMLSMVGLLVATVSKAKAWQIVLSVIMILMLAVIYAWGSGLVTMWLVEGEVMPIDQSYFWVAHLAMLTAVVSFFVLLYVAAASRISFASDNRSTRLRIVMLVQQTLLTGWCMYYALSYRDEAEEIFNTLFILSALYWIATGSLMCGENPQLSQRVKRTLPQSLFARSLLTWLNPGPGTGYIFAICNLLSVLVLGLVVAWEMKVQLGGIPLNTTPVNGLVMTFWNSLSDEWFLVGLFCFCYVACYLGAGRLILMLARRVARVGLFVSFLLQLVLLMLGAFAPWIVQMSIFYSDDYTTLQLSNWFWTIKETIDGNILTHQAKFLFWTFPVVPWVLVPGTGLMVLLNLLLSSREVIHERQDAPQRVVDDERALHPERYERPTKLSPWDDDPAEPTVAKAKD